MNSNIRTRRALGLVTLLVPVLLYGDSPLLRLLLRIALAVFEFFLAS